MSKREWSGVLFFKVLEGDIDEPESLKLEARDLYLMDVGSQAFTSFEYGPEIMAAYDEDEDLMDCRTGMIHSHHSMKAYFSATDVEELQDRIGESDFFLSLIVNADGQWVAKVAYIAFKHVDQTVNQRFTTINKREITKKNTSAIEQKIMHSIDLTIVKQFDGLLNLAKRTSELYDTRITEESKREASRMTNRTNWKNAKPEFNQLPVFQTDAELYACILTVNAEYTGSLVDAINLTSQQINHEMFEVYTQYVVDNMAEIYQQVEGIEMDLLMKQKVLMGMVKILTQYEEIDLIAALMDDLEVELEHVDEAIQSMTFEQHNIQWRGI